MKGLRSYHSIVKDFMRERDWRKITVYKAVSTINNSPDFLLTRNSRLFIEVALEDEYRFQQLLRLMPEVAKQVQSNKLEIILESLITHDALYQKVNVRDKVLKSFGWGIETVLQETREDDVFLEKFKEVLNKVASRLEEDGYNRIIVHLTEGIITRVDKFELEDLKNQMVRLDIIEHKNITHSNQNN